MSAEIKSTTFTVIVCVAIHGPLVTVYNKVLLPIIAELGKKLPVGEIIVPGGPVAELVTTDHTPPAGDAVIVCTPKLLQYGPAAESVG